MRRLLVLALLAGGLLLPARAWAHDSPEHVIDDLTVQIQRRGASAELLYRRASEYRVLGRLDRALADLQGALQLDPAYLPAHLERARVLLSQGETKHALEATAGAQSLAKSPAERATWHVVRSQVLRALGRLDEALAQCQQACVLRPGDVDLYLQRSELQADLGQHRERIEALREARSLNPSVVLEIEEVEAQIAAGHLQTALQHIETQLADSRWQSSWLIRRARVLRQSGEEQAARIDLQAALAEINVRLHPSRPDLGLLLDRGTIHALLGDATAARADLEAARARFADPRSLERLERLIASLASPAR